MAAVFPSSSPSPSPSPPPLPSSSSSSSSSFSFVPSPSAMPNPNSLEEALFECVKNWENPSNPRSFSANTVSGSAAAIPISDMGTTEMAAYTTETLLHTYAPIASHAMDSYYPAMLASSASSPISAERKLASSSAASSPISAERTMVPSLVNGSDTANVISAIARPSSSPRSHQIQKARSRRSSSRRSSGLKTILADQSNFVAMVKQYTGMTPTALNSLLNSTSPLASSSCLVSSLASASASASAAAADSDFLWDYPIPNSSPVNPSYQSISFADYHLI